MSIKAKHTAGPWSTHDYHDGDYRIHDCQDRLVATVREVGIEPAERVPNAKLIAAAPDLLAACRKALDAVDSPHYDPPRNIFSGRCEAKEEVRDALTEAIAKAGG